MSVLSGWAGGTKKVMPPNQNIFFRHHHNQQHNIDQTFEMIGENVKSKRELVEQAPIAKNNFVPHSGGGLTPIYTSEIVIQGSQKPLEQQQQAPPQYSAQQSHLYLKEPKNKNEYIKKKKFQFFGGSIKHQSSVEIQANMEEAFLSHEGTSSSSNLDVPIFHQPAQRPAPKLLSLIASKNHSQRQSPTSMLDFPPQSQLVMEAIQKSSKKHGSISPIRIQNHFNTPKQRYSSMKKQRNPAMNIEQDYYENHFRNLPSQQQKRRKEEAYYKSRIVNNTQLYISHINEKVAKKGSLHKGLAPQRARFQHIVEGNGIEGASGLSIGTNHTYDGQAKQKVRKSNLNTRAAIEEVAKLASITRNKDPNPVVDIISYSSPPPPQIQYAVEKRESSLKANVIHLPNIYNLLDDEHNFINHNNPYGDMSLTRYVSQVHGIRGGAKQNRSFLEVLEEKALYLNPPQISIKHTTTEKSTNIENTPRAAAVDISPAKQTQLSPWNQQMRGSMVMDAPMIIGPPAMREKKTKSSLSKKYQAPQVMDEETTQVIVESLLSTSDKRQQNYQSI